MTDKTQAFYAAPSGKSITLDNHLTNAFNQWKAALDAKGLPDTDSFKVRNAHMVIMIEAAEGNIDKCRFDLDDVEQSRQSGDIWDDKKDGVYLEVNSTEGSHPATVFGIRSNRVT